MTKFISKSQYQFLIDKEKKILDEIEITKVALRAAREMGDLRENEDYSASRARLSSLDNKLSATRSIINTCQVVEIKSPKEITVCTQVTLERMDGKKEVLKYRIVDTEFADFTNGLIEVSNHIGGLLLGKKVGDIVKGQFEVTQPICNYKITQIEGLE
jgi:transcription elongation GreA/GreB family factor